MLGQPGVTSKAMGPHCPLGYRSEPRQGRKPLGVLSVFFYTQTVPTLPTPPLQICFNLSLALQWAGCCGYQSRELSGPGSGGRAE